MKIKKHSLVKLGHGVSFGLPINIFDKRIALGLKRLDVPGFRAKIITTFLKNARKQWCCIAFSEFFKGTSILLRVCQARKISRTLV